MFLSPLLSPPLLPLPLPKDCSSWLINFQTFSNGAMFVLFPPLFLFSFNHLLPPLFLLFIYLNLLLIPSSFLLLLFPFLALYLPLSLLFLLLPLPYSFSSHPHLLRPQSPAPIADTSFQYLSLSPNLLPLFFIPSFNPPSSALPPLLFKTKEIMNFLDCSFTRRCCIYQNQIRTKRTKYREGRGWMNSKKKRIFFYYFWTSG